MPNPISLLIYMLFCHIIDDYYLQGILAQLKQRSYWREQAPDKMYKRDYLMALFMHCASWSFMITVPFLFVFRFDPPITSYLPLYIVNTIIHFITDNAKANKMKINLIQDQTIHMIQILFTWLVMCSVLHYSS